MIALLLNRQSLFFRFAQQPPQNKFVIIILSFHSHKSRSNSAIWRPGYKKYKSPEKYWQDSKIENRESTEVDFVLFLNYRLSTSQKNKRPAFAGLLFFMAPQAGLDYYGRWMRPA